MSSLRSSLRDRVARSITTVRHPVFVRAKPAVAFMALGMILAPLAAHGSLHDGDGTSWVSVETAHVVQALPGLPWAIGLIVLGVRRSRGAVRASVLAAAIGGALIFVSGLVGSRPRFHDQWESGPLLGALLLSLGVLAAAISLRRRLPRWLAIVAFLPIPGLIVGNILGNLVIDGGGRVAGETAFYASLSFALIGLAARMDRGVEHPPEGGDSSDNGTSHAA